MPKALEQKLKRQVADKDWPQERKDAYVYGTMRKTGWKPGKYDEPMRLVNAAIELQQGLDNGNIPASEETSAQMMGYLERLEAVIQDLYEKMPESRKISGHPYDQNEGSKYDYNEGSK